MLPLAPPLLETMTGTLSLIASCSAMIRAMVSPVPAPPGAGTITSMVLPAAGHVWASAGTLNRAASSAATRVMSSVRRMGVPFSFAVVARSAGARRTGRLPTRAAGGVDEHPDAPLARGDREHAAGSDHKP